MLLPWRFFTRDRIGLALSANHDTAMLIGLSAWGDKTADVTRVRDSRREIEVRSEVGHIADPLERRYPFIEKPSPIQRATGQLSPNGLEMPTAAQFKFQRPRPR